MRYFDKWYRAKGSCSIDSCIKVREWYDKSLEGLDRINLLFRYNHSAFKKIWGKPDAHWVGGSENRRFHIWLRPLGEGDTVIVFTHRAKGTVYEVSGVGYDTIGDYSKDIIIFLEDTVQKLRSL